MRVLIISGAGSGDDAPLVLSSSTFRELLLLISGQLRDRRRAPIHPRLVSVAPCGTRTRFNDGLNTRGSETNARSGSHHGSVY